MKNMTTIELTKPYLEFSAGHFTVFSETKREKLHGHNFNVHAEITAEVTPNGMAFDYSIYKKKIYDLCRELNGYFLLANDSPYLKIVEEGNQYCCLFAQEKIYFPKDDVILMPLKNITVEELAIWFLNQLIAEKEEIKKYLIHQILIKVYSAPGQAASVVWERDE